jgi:hypothetical protein
VGLVVAAVVAKRLLALSVVVLAVGKMRAWMFFAAPLHRSGDPAAGAGAVADADVVAHSWGIVVLAEVACHGEVPA